MSEPDVSNLLTVAQAIEIIDAAPVAPRVVEMALADADGLVLAQDVASDRDYPPFDKSLMDGYAVRCVDLAAASHATLALVGEIPAGRSAARGLAAGEALAIMTGAPMPEGADGVVPVEDVERCTPSPRARGEGRREGAAATRDGSNLEPALQPAALDNPLPAQGEREQIRILRATAPGRFIAKRGSDVREGAVVLTRGTRLGPAQLAAAASVGAGRVRVYAKPRVAVLATGDELVPVNQEPGPAQIRNSNTPMLLSLLKRLGCDVTDLGVVRDTPDAVRDALARAISMFDVLFVTGGMSMGAHDYVPRTLLDLGVDLRITKLRIKPGKPFVFGEIPAEKTGKITGTQLVTSRVTEGTEPGAQRVSGRFVFGLPGNPVSGFVCTVRLAARLLARMSGGGPEPRWVTAPLLGPLAQNGPREFYQPAVLSNEGVRPLEWKGSADVYTLAAANCLLVRGAGEPPRPAGNAVRVLELPT